MLIEFPFVLSLLSASQPARTLLYPASLASTFFMSRCESGARTIIIVITITPATAREMTFSRRPRECYFDEAHRLDLWLDKWQNFKCIFGDTIFESSRLTPSPAHSNARPVAVHPVRVRFICMQRSVRLLSKTRQNKDKSWNFKEEIK